jgi:hypothetical protein
VNLLLVKQLLLFIIEFVVAYLYWANSSFKSPNEYFFCLQFDFYLVLKSSFLVFIRFYLFYFFCVKFFYLVQFQSLKFKKLFVSYSKKKMCLGQCFLNF